MMFPFSNPSGVLFSFTDDLPVSQICVLLQELHHGISNMTLNLLPWPFMSFRYRRSCCSFVCGFIVVPALHSLVVHRTGSVIPQHMVCPIWPWHWWKWFVYIMSWKLFLCVQPREGIDPSGWVFCRLRRSCCLRPWGERSCSEMPVFYCTLPHA